jgi:hypothetical protein
MEEEDFVSLVEEVLTWYCEQHHGWLDLVEDWIDRYDASPEEIEEAKNVALGSKAFRQARMLGRSS